MNKKDKAQLKKSKDSQVAQLAWNLKKSWQLQAKKPLSNTHTRNIDDPKAKKPLEITIDHQAIGFISSGQGMRDHDEDVCGIVVYNHFRPLSDDQICYCLYRSTLLMHYDFKNEVEGEINKQQAGSTLTASLQYRGKVFTINIGDSKTMLLLWNQSDQRMEIRALNWVQKPTDSDEMEKILKVKGEIQRGYLVRLSQYNQQIGIAVSRSIGDIDFDNFGLSHEPELTIYTMPKDEKGYLIHCCDGVTDVMNEKDIEIFYSLTGVSQQPADRLRREAYLRGSMDNISVVFMPIIEGSDLVVLSFVADGHRGRAVADYIQVHFAQVLLAQIKQQAGLSSKIEIAKELIY